MLVEHVLTKQTRSTNEKEGANIQRRTFLGGALAALLLSSQRVMATCTDELLQIVQTNGLAHIELQQHQDRTMQRDFAGLRSEI